MQFHFILVSVLSSVHARVCYNKYDSVYCEFNLSCQGLLAILAKPFCNEIEEKLRAVLFCLQQLCLPMNCMKYQICIEPFFFSRSRDVPSWILNPFHCYNYSENYLHGYWTNNSSQRGPIQRKECGAGQPIVRMMSANGPWIVSAELSIVLTQWCQ